MRPHEPSSGPDAEPAAGESRSRRRRRLFAIFIGAMLLAGLVIGVLAGMASVGDLKLTREAAWLLTGAGGLILSGLIFWFHRWIDEVENQDNLWANTVGLYAGLIGGGAWVFLAELGHAPRVDLGALFVLMFGSAALYYFAVKIWRMF